MHRHLAGVIAAGTFPAGFQHVRVHIVRKKY
jgi:hypothetical protein